MVYPDQGFYLCLPSFTEKPLQPNSAHAHPQSHIENSDAHRHEEANWLVMNKTMSHERSQNQKCNQPRTAQRRIDWCHGEHQTKEDEHPARTLAGLGVITLNNATTPRSPAWKNWDTIITSSTAAMCHRTTVPGRLPTTSSVKYARNVGVKTVTVHQTPQSPHFMDAERIAGATPTGAWQRDSRRLRLQEHSQKAPQVIFEIHVMWPFMSIRKRNKSSHTYGRTWSMFWGVSSNMITRTPSPVERGLKSTPCRLLPNNGRRDCLSPDSGTANHSLCVLCNATTALSRRRKYMADIRIKHRGITHVTHQANRQRAPTIETVSILLDILHEEEKRWVATITLAIFTARVSACGLVYIAKSMRRNRNQEDTKRPWEDQKKNRRRKEEMKNKRRKGWEQRIIGKAESIRKKKGKEEILQELTTAKMAKICLYWLMRIWLDRRWVSSNAVILRRGRDAMHNASWYDGNVLMPQKIEQLPYMMPHHHGPNVC